MASYIYTKTLNLTK